MAIETLTVTSAFTPLDLLLWLRLKREVPGLVEDTLARNPGLCALGPMLPVGTRVVVDLPEAPARAPTRPLTTLYTL